VQVMPASSTANLAPKPNTRRRNGSISTPEELQDIKNAHDGRKFLEKHSLLCPPGEPATNAALSCCLHQISAMAGVPKQSVNAIRAAAFLLEEIEELAINETIRSAFDNHVTEFTTDMKLLVEDVNTKITDHLKTAMGQLEKAAEKGYRATAVSTPPAQASTNTYAAALVNPLLNVNPKLAAKEGIKARQFLLTGIKESPFGQYDTQRLKAEFNRIARELGLKDSEGKVRSVVCQRDGNTLFEVDSDAAATWFTNISNRIEFSSAIGLEVTFRSRLYNVLAFNAPLNLDPEDQSHREEINEANGLEEGTIVSLRWAKPIDRRSAHQRSAHLVLSFTDADYANRAISGGILICNKKCHVERIKKEPLRCLKCQGWNHIARECAEMFSTCSNCAGKHKTADCTQPNRKRCVSCKSEDHASWSRECPTFLRKAEGFNERNPDNLLPFFPTSDPWTWATNVANNRPSLTKARSQNPMAYVEEQRNAKGKEPARNNVHEYASKGWPAALDAELDNLGDEGWGEVTRMVPSATPGPSTRTRNTPTSGHGINANTFIPPNTHLPLDSPSNA
jgi:hypothetical protein